MIQERTILNVADNSGAKKVRCFRVMKGLKRRYAGLGDVVMASVQDAIPHGNIKKGDVVTGVVSAVADNGIEVDINGSYDHIIVQDSRRGDEADRRFEEDFPDVYAFVSAVQKA